MNICGLQKLTLLDYPGYMACTIFVGGCNFRCPFCHNSELVLKPNSAASITEEAVFAFLESRIGKLEGVCITGGEPTLQPDLIAFIQKVKSLGYRVKLDTNGQTPHILQILLAENLLDYVAMDVKNSKARYGETIGIDQFNVDAVDVSISILLASDIHYEFRTTVCSELHTVDDIREIGEWIQGAKRYYLQPYRKSPQVMVPNRFHTPEPDVLQAMLSAAAAYVGKVTIRGQE